MGEKDQPMQFVDMDLNVIGRVLEELAGIVQRHARHKPEVVVALGQALRQSLHAAPREPALAAALMAVIEMLPIEAATGAGEHIETLEHWLAKGKDAERQFIDGSNPS